MRALTGILCLLAMAPHAALAEESPDPPPAESAPPKARPPHPEPRVIVNVLAVRGPHERPQVERSARLGWGRIVGCYNRHGGGKRGQAVIELTLSGAGKVLDTAKKRSSFEPELLTCLRGALRRLAMPQARARSTAVVEIQLAPGDPS
jgi:hypothetical protein